MTAGGRRGIWLVATVAAVIAAALIAVADDDPPASSDAAATAGAEEAVSCPSPRRGAWRRGADDRRAVAVTFDDGPSAQTPKVLRALRRHEARATFFVLGREIPGREGILRRIARDGHEIGNHSTSHAEDPDATDIEIAGDLIADATGRRPCVFRPPGGRLTARLVRTVRRLGMTTVTWDVDPADWAMQDPAVLRDRVLADSEPGSIILMHDGGGDRTGTARSISALIEDLRRAGYELVTVSELLEGASASEPGATVEPVPGGAVSPGA